MGDLVWMGVSLGLLPEGLPVSGFAGLWWLDLSLPFVPVGLELFAQSARTGSLKEIDNVLRLPITP